MQRTSPTTAEIPNNNTTYSNRNARRTLHKPRDRNRRQHSYRNPQHPTCPAQPNRLKQKLPQHLPLPRPYRSPNPTFFIRCGTLSSMLFIIAIPPTVNDTAAILTSSALIVRLACSSVFLNKSRSPSPARSCCPPSPWQCPPVRCSCQRLLRLAAHNKVNGHRRCIGVPLSQQRRHRLLQLRHIARRNRHSRNPAQALPLQQSLRRCDRHVHRIELSSLPLPAPFTGC
jgi:hypothetical protein